MITTLIILEVLSLTATIARWSRRKEAGIYIDRYGEDNDSGNALIGHFFAGLFPPVAMGMMLGSYLNQKDVEKKKKEQELSTIQQEVNLLVGRK